MNNIIRPAVWLATSFALALMAACSGGYAWDEEFQTSDGQVRRVTRTADFRENWMAGGGGGSYVETMTLTVLPLGDETPPAIWNFQFVPMILDREPASGEWTVIASFFHCDSWYALGRPKLPYVEFRFRGQHWVRQSLDPRWIGRKANLLIADPAALKAAAGRNPIPLDFKSKHESRHREDAFSKVVNEWTTTC